VAAQGREINTRKLGNFIAKHERRVEAGMRVERAGERSGVALWREVEVEFDELFEMLSQQLAETTREFVVKQVDSATDERLWSLAEHLTW
jgi:hypothetical protein